MTRPIAFATWSILLVVATSASDVSAQGSQAPITNGQSADGLNQKTTQSGRLQTNQAAAQNTRPEKLTVTVGDVLIRIDGPKLWTLSGVDYRGSEIAVQGSAYGSVINIKDVGFLGSAHFLDVPGKPGEVEKEQVSLVKFELDQRPISEITPTMNLSGKSFHMTRESTIRAVQLSSSVTLENGVLTESVRMKTNSAVDLKVTYPLMYAWSPQTTEYLFGDDKGVQKRGTFSTENAKPSEGLEKTARWMAVYNPQAQQGAILYVVQRPAMEDVWLQFTDAPGVYRKLRLMSFTDKTMPAGFDGTFQVAVGFFAAKSDEWEPAAVQRMSQLRRR